MPGDIFSMVVGYDLIEYIQNCWTLAFERRIFSPSHAQYFGDLISLEFEKLLEKAVPIHTERDEKFTYLSVDEILANLRNSYEPWFDELIPNWDRLLARLEQTYASNLDAYAAAEEYDQCDELTSGKIDMTGGWGKPAFESIPDYVEKDKE